MLVAEDDGYYGDGDGEDTGGRTEQEAGPGLARFSVSWFLVWTRVVLFLNCSEVINGSIDASILVSSL